MELLRPAAEVLRRALQRMDEEDVPASLRPLADSSARRFPPPLLKRALVELDGSEWLRAEALAEDGLEPDSAPYLFVDRPEGWELTLTAQIERGEQQRLERSRSELEEKLRDALERIDVLESQLKAASREASAAERRERERMRAEIEGAQRARRLAERQARDEAHEAARLASRVERLQAELDVMEDRLETMRQLLEKERRSAAGETSSPSRSWFPDEPLEMATELDRIITAVRRRPVAEVIGAAEGFGLKLPAGLRPDRIEAVQWLIRRPVQWLIDGYNVAFQVADDGRASVRDRVVAAAGRLAALAPSGSMVVVVFDSSVDTASLAADRRVRVVFAPSADEWILDHGGPGVVVVSSDRRVREGAESAGALGIWSEALVAWIDAGGALGSRSGADR